MKNGTVNFTDRIKKEKIFGQKKTWNTNRCNWNNPDGYKAFGIAALEDFAELTKTWYKRKLIFNG